jgi:hypothetical protein
MSHLGQSRPFSIRFRVGFDLNFGHIFCIALSDASGQFPTHAVLKKVAENGCAIRASGSLTSWEQRRKKMAAPSAATRVASSPRTRFYLPLGVLFFVNSSRFVCGSPRLVLLTGGGPIRTKAGIDAATRTDKGIFRGGQIIRSLCVHPSQSEQSDLAKIFSGNSTPLARVEKIDRESRF